MKSFGIGTKLLVCFTLLFSFLLVFGIVTLISFSQMQDTFTRAVNETARKLVLADKVNIDESGMLSAQRGVLQFTLLQNQPRVEALRSQFHTLAESQMQRLQVIRPMLVTAEGHQLVDQMESNVQQWNDAFSSMETLLASGRADEAMHAAESTLPLSDAIAASADKLDKLAVQLLENDKKAAQAKFTECRWISFIVFLLALSTGIMTVVLVHRISGELGRVASELNSGSAQVASAASQVSAASQALAQGAAEQAAAIEETSASTLEINSMTRNNADSSKSAEALVNQAATGFELTNQKLREMVLSMEEINASSDKISKIIKIIDSIAFQTNILALNAAVEAARAGESGMGFAVVADEVRSLAQRCAQAARDTSALIQESMEKCHEGSARLEAVEASVHELSGGSSQIKVLVEEVSVASHEQARGLEQINKAISEMEQVTQRNAASSEESAAAGEELNAQSEALHHIVLELNRLVHGTGQQRESEHSVAVAPRAAAPLKSGKVSLPRPAIAAALRSVVKKPSAHALSLREQIEHEEEFQEI